MGDILMYKFGSKQSYVVYSAVNVVVPAVCSDFVHCVGTLNCTVLYKLYTCLFMDTEHAHTHTHT